MLKVSTYEIDKEKSKEDLLKSIEPYILNLASKLGNKTNLIEDLIQEGYLVSLIAYKHWLEKGECAFLSYVYRAISVAMYNYRMDSRQPITVTGTTSNKKIIRELKKKGDDITHTDVVEIVQGNNTSLERVLALHTVLNPYPDLFDESTTSSNLNTLETITLLEFTEGLLDLNLDETERKILDNFLTDEPLHTGFNHSEVYSVQKKLRSLEQKLLRRFNLKGLQKVERKNDRSRYLDFQFAYK